MNRRPTLQKEHMSIKHIKGYLMSKGIPPAMVDKIREDLAWDAVEQSRDIKYDRIYSAVALLLRRKLKFGPKRIVDMLSGLDEIMEEAIKLNGRWDILMSELRDETGIVIRTDEENRVILENWREH